MKKLLLYILMIMLLCFSFDKVYAYSSTGYKEFEEIEILRENVYLLNNTLLTTKKKDLQKVKWRFFGPSVYVKNKNVSVKYKKYDAFSRSNRTNNALEYEYTYRVNMTGEMNVENSTSVGADASVKIDIVNAKIEESIKKSIGASLEVGVMKEVNYTITVDPHTKVTMYITGDAMLSQGAVKYYLFGIPIYKSNWEYIDVITEYYEFNEEIYK